MYHIARLSAQKWLQLKANFTNQSMMHTKHLKAKNWFWILCIKVSFPQVWSHGYTTTLLTCWLQRTIVIWLLYRRCSTKLWTLISLVVTLIEALFAFTTLEMYWITIFLLVTHFLLLKKFILPGELLFFKYWLNLRYVHNYSVLVAKKPRHTCILKCVCIQ